MRNPGLQYLFFLFLFFSCSKDDSQTNNDVERDKIAPTLSFSISGTPTNSNEPIIISETVVVNVEATDASGIDKVEAFKGTTKIGEDTSAPFSISIDINNYISINGENDSDINAILKIVAKDNEGNEASLDQDEIINTREVLITINIPEDFLNSFFQNVSVFASDMNGNYLEGTNQTIANDTRKIKLFAPESFDFTNQFMVTFMS